MSTLTKVDYDALEREFIVTDLSLREMAKREGISNSTLSDVARRDKWADKRASYKQQELENFIRGSAQRNAERLARLSELSIDVLEGQLVRFAEELTQHLDKDGNKTDKEPIFISPQDAREVVKMIQLLRGQPTERTEENIRGVNVHTIDPGLLNALGGLARRSLEPRRVGRSDPIALPRAASVDPEREPEAESA